MALAFEEWVDGWPDDVPSSSSSAASDDEFHGKRESYWHEVGSYIVQNRALLLTSFFDYFDWAAYPYLVPHFTKSVFGGNEQAAWAVGAVMYIAAPLGSMTLGWAADRYGRKLTYTVGLGMAIGGTFTQGMAPPLRIWGPLTMFVARFVSGVGLGAKVAIGNAYASECASQRVRSMSRLVVMGPGAFGVLTLGALVLSLNSTFNEAQMAAWGWRVPFFLASLIGLIPMALFHFEAEESSEYETAHARQAAGPKEHTSWSYFIQTTWAPGLLAVIGILCDSATHGLGENYLNAWLIKFGGHSFSSASVIVMLTQVVCLPVMVVTLAVADCVGVGKVALATTCYVAATSFPLWSLPYHYPCNTAVMVWVVLGSGVGYGMRTCFLSWACELFPTERRARALGICLSLANISSGLAPVYCDGGPLRASWYLLVSALISSTAFVYSLLSHRHMRSLPSDVERDGPWLRTTHVVRDPY